MVKSLNRILFAETQNAKMPSRSIGMRHLPTSTEFKQLLPFFQPKTTPPLPQRFRFNRFK
jgi:hypothetical protein